MTTADPIQVLRCFVQDHARGPEDLAYHLGLLDDVRNDRDACAIDAGGFLGERDVLRARVAELEAVLKGENEEATKAAAAEMADPSSQAGSHEEVAALAFRAAGRVVGVK